jgi:N-acetylglucosaminyl-diphospho-decaprenol L-rhamnosyltransferase
MHIPVVDIIIVDYNSGHLVHDCLVSMVAHFPRSVVLDRVVVVDNASQTVSDYHDGSPDLPLRIIRNPRNRGFAAACNQGAADSTADYVLFLNPDTAVNANSLSIPIRFMEQAANERVGICGVQLIDEHGLVSRSCARFPSTRMFLAKMFGLDRVWPQRFPPHFMAEWDHAKTQPVDQVMGAFFLVRRSLFEALGGFDERFFVYFDEVDFSWRARRAGWLTYYVAEAQVYHRGGGASEQVKASRLFYSLRSRILYGYKHFGWLSATVLALATLLIEPVTRGLDAVLKRSPSLLKETIQGYGLLWCDALTLFRSSRPAVGAAPQTNEEGRRNTSVLNERSRCRIETHLPRND